MTANTNASVHYYRTFLTLQRNCESKRIKMSLTPPKKIKCMIIDDWLLHLFQLN